jgi:hypothetical protein
VLAGSWFEARALVMLRHSGLEAHEVRVELAINRLARC